jgi:YegS/Rv2252/BmrU family lipid kinase
VEKATILLNPRARNAPSFERLRSAALRLKSEGWEVDVRPTDAARHATALAREAATAGASVVLACGGDGTLNEVVNGLVGTPSAAGVIRSGMGNVFAKEVGVPRAPEAALGLLIEGERRRFDLGVAGERYFLLLAGVGFDALVVRSVPEGPKRLLGTASYILWGLRKVARYQPRRARLCVDGETLDCDLAWLLLGNTRSYGGVLSITSKALVDDGCLDGYLFCGRGPLWMTSLALRLLLGRQDRAKGVTFRRLRELVVETPGLPVQADGEDFGDTPMRFTVALAALDVLLPRGKAGRLFSTSEVDNR